MKFSNILLIAVVGVLAYLLLFSSTPAKTQTEIKSPLTAQEIQTQTQGLPTLEHIFSPLTQETPPITTENILVSGSFTYNIITQSWILDGKAESVPDVYLFGTLLSFFPESGETIIYIQAREQDANGIQTGKVYELQKNIGKISVVGDVIKEYALTFKRIPKGKYLIWIYLFENDKLVKEKIINYGG